MKNIGESFSGLSGKKSSDFGHGEAKYITYLNILNNPIIDTKLTDKIEIDNKQHLVKKGDIFFTISSETPQEVGLSSVLDTNLNECYLNSFSFGYRLKEISMFDNLFNSYNFRSPNFRRKMYILAQGISRYNISKKAVLNETICFPKISEQKQIGKLIKLMNSLLSLQHRKMELENQTSKAIYNYLFDKNKPFYFKDNKTKKVFLKELGTTYSGLSGKNKTDFGHGKAKYITYLNVNKNTIANHNLLDLIEIDKKQNEVLNGDILFTISSETPEEVGLASLWPYDDTNIYLNSFCFGFRPNSKINNLWLAYELRSLKIRKNMYKLAQGISRYNLSKKSVLNLQVDVPSDAEQNFDSKFVKLINIQTKFLSNERNELLLLKKFLLQNLFI
ncbi:restriction endonuclease subunit S [Lactobacillus jensenii]|uniref:restriction endonuclease subunit S n=1 Tax=Lactobacillus jensenii TaxID=109790 RepID=UPI0002E323FF